MPFAHRGDDGQLPRRQQRPGPNHDVSDNHVLSGPPDVAAGGDSLSDFDAVGSRIGHLDGDDAIGPGRDRSTGHDAHRTPGPQSNVRSGASGNIVDDGQGHRRGLSRSGHVTGDYRVAVHGRVVEGG